MARKAGIRDGALGLARDVATILAADNTVLTDANIVPTLAISCRGFETVYVGIEVDAGANPQASIEPLFRDGDAADGERWKRIFTGSRDGVTALAAPAAHKTPVMAEGELHELRVHGQLSVFFRIDAVANVALTTGFRVLVLGGKRL